MYHNMGIPSVPDCATSRWGKCLRTTIVKGPTIPRARKDKGPPWILPGKSRQFSVFGLCLQNLNKRGQAHGALWATREVWIWHCVCYTQPLIGNAYSTVESITCYFSPPKSNQEQPNVCKRSKWHISFVGTHSLRGLTVNNSLISNFSGRLIHDGLFSAKLHSCSDHNKRLETNCNLLRSLQ